MLRSAWIGSRGVRAPVWKYQRVKGRRETVLFRTVQSGAGGEEAGALNGLPGQGRTLQMQKTFMDVKKLRSILKERSFYGAMASKHSQVGRTTISSEEKINLRVDETGLR
jgi:hypothetical protein